MESDLASFCRKEKLPVPLNFWPRESCVDPSKPRLLLGQKASSLKADSKALLPKDNIHITHCLKGSFGASEETSPLYSSHFCALPKPQSFLPSLICLQDAGTTVVQNCENDQPMSGLT